MNFKVNKLSKAKDIDYLVSYKELKKEVTQFPHTHQMRMILKKKLFKGKCKINRTATKNPKFNLKKEVLFA